MKIVNPDYMWFDSEHLEKLKSLGEFVRYEKNAKNTDGIIERTKDAEIVIDFWFPITKEMLGQLPKLKMICVAATGYDWIDIIEAKKRGIVVSNCPGHNVESVAEHTIGLMLAAARNTVPAIESLRKGKWEPTSFKGLDLKGKTLGVIGYGMIGKRVAAIASSGLGMNILWTNSKSSRKDLENLLKKSDVITVNSLLNDKTRNLITSKEFKLMKNGVIVVNTGRGAIINEEDFLQNLKNGKVKAAGIDSYVFEPPKKLVPFTKLKNVVATPHIAWDTEETDYYLSEMVVDNVEAFIRGKPINVVK